MQTNDLAELLRKLTGQPEQRADASQELLQGWRDAGAIASDVRQLSAAQAWLPAQASSSASRPTSVASEAAGSSTAATVLKTAGLMTGVGPLVTGLVKLFGSRGGASDPPALATYSLPERVSVDAGLAGDRSFVPVSYSDAGSARAGSASREQGAAATQIHVNVQAMDSRSFLDHSDDIARAVKDAMLRSHSLNDVVSEL